MAVVGVGDMYVSDRLTNLNYYAVGPWRQISGWGGAEIVGQEEDLARRPSQMFT